MPNNLQRFYEQIANRIDDLEQYHQNTVQRNEYFQIEFDSHYPDENDLINQWIGADVDKRLTLFALDVDVPNFVTFGNDEMLTTDFGPISLPPEGNIVPETNELPINFLSTERSVHELYFYTWMRESMSNIWVYHSFPFTKANITVSMLSSVERSIPAEVDEPVKSESIPITTYKFYAAYPINIGTPEPTSEVSGEFQRTVTFRFSLMTQVSNPNQ